MKCSYTLTTVLFLAFLASWLPAQEIDEEPESQGTTLPDFIGQISEMDEIGAAEYLNMASGTIQLGHQMKAAGQQLPPSVIYDALDAVDEGKRIDSSLGDWHTLEETLHQLLEPPPQQNQQDQEQSQDGESEEEQEGESGENGSSQESGENSEEQQRQQDSEQGSEGEQGSKDQQEGENGEQSSESQESESQSGDESDEEQPGEMPKAQDGAQMGDLQDQSAQDIQLDGEEAAAQQEQEEMQTLGGQQASGEMINAENAALMQMLEQLKQQDEPGKLYQILQDAQSGEQQNSQPSAKDW